MNLACPLPGGRECKNEMEEISMAKKLLALVLSVLMLVSLLPMSAFATGEVEAVAKLSSNGKFYDSLRTCFCNRQ